MSRDAEMAREWRIDHGPGPYCGSPEEQGHWDESLASLLRAARQEGREEVLAIADAEKREGVLIGPACDQFDAPALFRVVKRSKREEWVLLSHLRASEGAPDA